MILDPLKRVQKNEVIPSLGSRVIQLLLLQESLRRNDILLPYKVAMSELAIVLEAFSKDPILSLHGRRSSKPRQLMSHLGCALSPELSSRPKFA